MHLYLSCFHKVWKLASVIYHATCAIKKYFYSLYVERRAKDQPPIKHILNLDEKRATAILTKYLTFKSQYNRNVKFSDAVLINIFVGILTGLIWVGTYHLWRVETSLYAFWFKWAQNAEMKAATRDPQGMQNCQRYQIVWREQASFSYQLSKQECPQLTVMRCCQNWPHTLNKKVGLKRFTNVY